MPSEKFEIFYHDGSQPFGQSNVCPFTQKVPFHARAINLIWAKIIQPYISRFIL